MSPNAQQDIDTFAFVYPTGEPSKQAIRDSALYQHLTHGKNVPYLRIRFSDISSSSRGITFGSDQSCHVVLEGDKEAMIYDWSSRNGTYVVYNEHGRHLRKYFKWIVGGHTALDHWKPISVELGARWKFTIEVPRYTAETIFPTRVDEELEDVFEALRLRRDKVTRLHSCADSPTSEPIQLIRPLASGSYGSVVHSFDVSTGQELALKKPKRGKRVNYPAWVKEAKIMEGIDHENIVKLIRSDLRDQENPMLVLEFVPGGQLGCRGPPLQPSEIVQVLSQLLGALDYLHTMPEPIVHRDIKQDNVLVQERSDGRIWVKFADFGVSKAGETFETAIGCPQYRAPEMFESDRYTTAVDIWTLGVMMLHLMGCLPRNRGELSRNWCETIIKEAAKAKAQNPLIQFVLDHMVQMSPDRRLSAKKCQDELQRQYSSEEDEPSTLDVSDMSEEGSSTPRAPPQEEGNQSTLVLAPSRKSLPTTSSGPVPGAESSLPLTKRKIPEESDYMPSTPGMPESDFSTIKGPPDDLSPWRSEDKRASGETRDGLRFHPVAVGGSTKEDTRGGTEAGTGRDTDGDGDANADGDANRDAEEGHRAKRARLDDAES